MMKVLQMFNKKQKYFKMKNNICTKRKQKIFMNKKKNVKVTFRSEYDSKKSV